MTEDTSASATPIPQPIPQLKRGSPLMRWALGAFVTLVVLGSVGAAGLTAWGRLPDFKWEFSAAWLTAAFLGFTALNIAHGSLWRLIIAKLGIPPWVSPRPCRRTPRLRRLVRASRRQSTSRSACFG